MDQDTVLESTENTSRHLGTGMIPSSEKLLSRIPDGVLPSPLPGMVCWEAKVLSGRTHAEPGC